MARIKGLKDGKTNITVSYGGKSATFSNFTVNKKTVTFSAPTLRSVSKYNGNGQALINSGSCTTGGTMYYYVSTSSSTPTFNTGSWTTTVPSKTNAGTYYLWYYVYVSDTGVYTGTGINTVTKVGNGSVTIPKADNSITVTSTSATIYVHSSHTYNNTTQLSVSGAKGSVTYSSSDTGKATVNSSGLVTSKSAGTVTITATDAGNTNYKSSTASCTVKVVTDTYTDTWNNPSISKYSYSNIGAGGGTSTPTVTVTQSGTRTWASGYSSQSLSNSTFNYSYSMTTGNGFSINTTNGNITADSRGTTTGSERSSNTATVTVTGSGSKSNTKTAVCKQNANALTNTNYSPSNYTVSVSIGNGLTAAGGSATVTASASHKAYDYYTSGSYNNQHTVTDSVTWVITTQTFTPSGGSASTITRFSKSGNTLSHTTMGTSAGTDYVTVTAYNTTSTSATASAEKSITNTKDSTNYAPYNYTASVSIGNGLWAGGGEATVSASASHMAYDYYTSGSYNNSHSVTDGVSWSITSQYINSPSNGIDRFSKSGNTLSHTTMGTSAGTDYVTVTAYNTTSTSATASAEKSITNTKDSTNYAPYNYTASVSIGNGLWAGGGEATVSASASHMAYDYYTSGSYNNSHSVTDGVSWSITTQTFTPSGGSASTITRFSKSGNTLSHTTMTSNIGTDYVKVTAVNGSSSSTTASAEKSITNELGTQKYKNTSGTTGYNIVYTVPTVSIRSELSAAGGTATVTCSVTNNTNWYQKYTSGTYTGQKTSTETGIARWMITSNGNSRFSHPSSGGTSLSGVGTVYNTGTKISHSNMTTNATTDTVTVTAYNIGDISKTKTASESVSNALTGISISLGSNPINYNTTTTATVTATYTSGSSKDVTSSLSTSSSATSNYIKSGDTSVVTVS